MRVRVRVRVCVCVESRIAAALRGAGTWLDFVTSAQAAGGDGWAVPRSDEIASLVPYSAFPARGPLAGPVVRVCVCVCVSSEGDGRLPPPGRGARATGALDHGGFE